MGVANEMEYLAQKAKTASRKLAHASPAAKNLFLERLCKLLEVEEAEILASNARDLELAKKAGLDDPRLNRLTLTPAIMAEMRKACKEVAAFPDPVGATESQWQRPNGLLVGKMRIPIGVIAMIYEARPNVTIDAAILCVKAGNSVILRGGREAVNSNMALARLLRQALHEAALPEDGVQLVGNADHAAVRELCRLDQYIDVLIPCGGEKLVASVCEAATMPVLKHYKGVCHAYVDAGADIGQALEIIANAKAQRPGVCNALEALLVNAEIAPDFLPRLAKMMAGLGVELRACARSLPLLGPGARAQAPEDLGCEFHDLVLAVCVVENMEEALDHIARYGSRHTEIICTQDYGRAMRFLREADASMVAVNASTRFNDGGQLGLGAEIGISTSKLHAYGPMGLKELTTTKFVVLGNGQIRN